jgi:cytochrome c556
MISEGERWMRPLFCGAGVLMVMIVAALVAVPAGASSDDEIVPIKKVMKALHGGKNAPLSKLKTALKGDSPDWAEVRQQAKVFAKLGASLPKSDPPRGGKESYEKLAKAYASAGKSLAESAEKEDLDEVRDAFKKISTSCMPCHKSHRPN